MKKKICNVGKIRLKNNSRNFFILINLKNIQYGFDPSTNNEITTKKKKKILIYKNIK